MRRRLVNIDDRAVEIGVAHGKARTSHESRAVLNPSPRIIIVIHIQPDAVVEFHFGMSRRVAPRGNVSAIGFLRGKTGVFRRERGKVEREEVLEGLGRPVLAIRAHMRAKVESLIMIGKRLPGCKPRTRVQPAGRAVATPICDGTWLRAFIDEHVECGLGTVRCAVVIAGHQDDCLLHAREIPEPRQWEEVTMHVKNHIGEEPLEFVGLRDLYFIQIYKIGVAVTAEEEIVRADWRLAVAILPFPGRISLPGIDNGSGEIEGKRRRLPTSVGLKIWQLPMRNRWIGSSLCGAGIEGRDLSRLHERIKVGGAMILNSLIDDAGAGLPGGVDLQIGVGTNRRGVSESEERSEFFVRTHGDQLSTTKNNPRNKHFRLRRGKLHFAEDGHFVWDKHRAIKLCYVEDVEAINPFGAQYLLIILRELIFR